MNRPTMSSMPDSSESRPDTVEPNTTSLPWRMPPSVTAHALCTATLSGTPAERTAASMSCSGTTAVSAKRSEGAWPSATREGPGRSASSSRQTRSLSSSSSAAKPAYVVGEAAERIQAARCVVLGQQGTEHRRDRPAVGDDVVHGLHQHVAAGTTGTTGTAGPAADERVPHERAGGQVETGAAVPLGVLADTGFGDPRTVQRGEGRLHPALQYGDHTTVGESDEARGQVRVEGEQPGRRRREPVGVHLALQREELLLDVAARRVVVEDRVEVEALLQRGQRQDVQQRRSVQGVHVVLGQRDQGEVMRPSGLPVRGRPAR